MTQLRIPDRDKNRLQLVRKLSPGDLATLKANLRVAKPALNPIAIADLVHQGMEADQEDVRQILILLLSMTAGMEATGLSASEFAAAICGAPNNDDDDDWGLLREDITELLESGNSLHITAKARTVRVAHPNVYVSSSVQSDVRPVFAEEVGIPDAATIVHTLQFSHRDSGGAASKDFFLALEMMDILDLKKQLDRAIQKEDALKELLAQTGTLVLMDSPSTGE